MRNQHGLTPDQIQHVERCWSFLTCVSPGGLNSSLASPAINYADFLLDTSQAHLPGSKTGFVESTRSLVLGADAFPSGSPTGSVNDNLSLLACLCHELAHAERFQLGFQRPFEYPERHLDEAETSLHASFRPELMQRDRHDLVADAALRIQHFQFHFEVLP